MVFIIVYALTYKRSYFSAADGGALLSQPCALVLVQAGRQLLEHLAVIVVQPGDLLLVQHAGHDGRGGNGHKGEGTEGKEGAVLVVGLVLLVLIGLRWYTARSPRCDLSTLEGRQAFLLELGWEIDPDSEEFRTVVVPEKLRKRQAELLLRVLQELQSLQILRQVLS